MVVRGLVADEDSQNVSSGAREWKLRRAPVLDALQYLITHSPPYMDPGNGVVIDEGRLTCIPEDGSVFDAVKVYMELGSYFLFLQEQIKDIIIMFCRTEKQLPPLRRLPADAAPRARRLRAPNAVQS